MKYLKLIFTILLGVFMIYGGVNHFLKPEFYNSFIPDFFSKTAVNYLSGIIEILLGIGVLLPKFRTMSAMGIFILMILFLPIHIWDVFREDPAIGNKTIALIRIPLQFLFMLWAWWIHRNKTKA